MTVTTEAAPATTPAVHDKNTRESTRPKFELRRRAHKVALTAHVLASVGWFGIAVVVAFCVIAARTTGDHAFSHALYRTIETVPWLSIPVGLLAVATGVLLGIGTTWGLVRHWWVVAKIAIAVAVIATDAVIVGQTAHDAAAGGSGAPLTGPTVAHVVVLAVATVLSVFKPRGRTPRGRRLLTRSG
jgi:hypothetical protein